MTAPSPRSLRGGLGAIAVAVSLALSFVPDAAASDTFVLDDKSSVASLQGVSDYTGPEQNGPQDLTGCTTGPFPGPSGTAYEFKPGDRGTIELTRDLFNPFCPSNIDPQSFSVSTPAPNGGGYWAPLDPLIGSATLTCGINGNSSPTVTASVDGLTCTVADAASAPAASFVSSAAPLRGNAAVALVQHFPDSSTPAGADPVRGRHQITIRDAHGKVHGRSRKLLVAGQPRTVRVPLSRTLRKRVVKRGTVEVKATLKRIDGKPGTGDRATLVVLADDSHLPF